MDLGYDFHSAFNDKYSLVARRMLRLLSVNARTSISEMRDALGVSRATVKKKLDSLSKELNISYTLELDERKLGLVSPHLITIKFRQKPDYKKIADLLLKSYIPQVAAVTEGSYDMIIYANAFSTSDYAHWDKSMRILLGEYGALWLPSEVVHRQLGSFPLRNEIIDKSPVGDKYRVLLRELNTNSRQPFQHLSAKLGMHTNTLKYNYDRLLKEGLIKRPTIAFDMPKGLCMMSFFSNYVPGKGYEASSATARLAFTSDDKDPMISRYLICAPLIGVHDFFTLGVFDDKNTAYKRDVLHHKTIFKKHGIRMEHAEVKEVMVGRLPVRSIDTKKEYNKIIWTPEFIR